MKKIKVFCNLGLIMLLFLSMFPHTAHASRGTARLQQLLAAQGKEIHILVPSSPPRPRPVPVPEPEPTPSQTLLQMIPTLMMKKST